MQVMPSGYPVEFGVQPPAEEQLNRVAKTVFQRLSYSELTPEQRVQVYQLCLAEIQACALAHLAEFTVRLY